MLPGREELEASIRRWERGEWKLWILTLVFLALLGGGLLVLSSVGAQPLLRNGWLWPALLALGLLLVMVYLTDRKRTLVQGWRRFLFRVIEESEEWERSMLDPITQVYSRRFLDEILPKEISRCARGGRPLSFLLVDLDNFKELNQRLGHFIGNQVLQGIASVLRDTLRSSDLVFRYGGDQFLVLLPEISAEGAGVAEARLRERLSSRDDLQELVGSPLRVVFGRTTYRQGQTIESVLEQAEDAVRTDGSDRIVIGKGAPGP